MATLPVGTTLGPYRIEGLIGRGGMGVVYLAEHVRLGRGVALKVLAPELSDSPGFRERFERECQTAASLDHPNIVPIYDAVEADGHLYVAMRYVRGTDLRSLLADEGRLAPDRAVSILAQIARALDAAHASGLVHRDVKPANILIETGSASIAPDGGERAYLGDFGLTKKIQSESNITATGQFLGTIDYVAPEQIQGSRIDGRADQYSLACVLYHILTGGVPFKMDTEVAIIYAHLSKEPSPLPTVRPELPLRLSAAVTRGMAKSPDDRYPSCSALTDAAARSLVPGSVAAATATVPAIGPPTAPLPPSAEPPTTAAPVVRADRARPRTIPTWAVAAGLGIVVAAGVAGALLLLRHPAPERTTTSPPTGAGPTPSSPSPAGPGALTVPQYVQTIDRDLANSASAVTTLAGHFVPNANSSDPSRWQLASQEIQSVIQNRRSLIDSVAGLFAPPAAVATNNLLLEALRASLESDLTYQRWVNAKIDGAGAQADAYKSSAVMHDQQVVDPLKLRFLRSYNAVRAEAGESSLPSDTRF